MMAESKNNGHTNTLTEAMQMDWLFGHYLYIESRAGAIKVNHHLTNEEINRQKQKRRRKELNKVQEVPGSNVLTPGCTHAHTHVQNR